MSVKSKTYLFRDLLYLQEVIKHKQICSASAQNGIKASNLSKIIKSIEEQTGLKLFIRNSHGLIPTEKSQQIAALIHEMENHFDQISEKIFCKAHNSEIKLYLTPNLALKNLHCFTETHPNLNLTICRSEMESDVSVGYNPPENQKGRRIIENKIGKSFSQTIWVACENNPNAIELARFIILELHKE